RRDTSGSLSEVAARISSERMGSSTARARIGAPDQLGQGCDRLPATHGPGPSGNGIRQQLQERHQARGESRTNALTLTRYVCAEGRNYAAFAWVVLVTARERSRRVEDALTGRPTSPRSLSCGRCETAISRSASFCRL